MIDRVKQRSSNVFMLPSILHEREETGNRRLAKLIHVEAGDRILHLGCGDGNLLNTIAKQASCALYGTTNNLKHMQHVRQLLPSADIVYTEPDDMPWLHLQFHLIISEIPRSTQLHIASFLQDIMPHLCKGGQLITTLAWYPSIIHQLVNHKAPDHSDSIRTHMTRYELMQIWSENGFTDVRWHYGSHGTVIITGKMDKA